MYIRETIHFLNYLVQGFYGNHKGDRLELKFNE